MTKEFRINEHGVVCVVTGGSGAGKGNLGERLLQKVASLVRPESLTTRPPRPNEHPGQYAHVSRAEFNQAKEEGFLLTCVEYNGHQYAYTLEAVREAIRQGKIPLLDAHIDCVPIIIGHFPQARTFFLVVPCENDLRERLLNRNDLTREQIEQRIELSREEHVTAQSFGVHIIPNLNGRIEATLEAALKHLRVAH